jgi:hypothetical protein
MRMIVFAFVAVVCLIVVFEAAGQPGPKGKPVSEATAECLDCHEIVSPGIVADWRRSRHAKTTPSEALKKPKLERRMSSEKIPDGLSGVVVGCAECHKLNPGKHKDTFEHSEHKVHVVVTPADCAACHKVEVEQYSKNIMAHAYGNLKNNPVFQSLEKSINGLQSYESGKLTEGTADSLTSEDSCYVCHGTRILVKGLKEVETDFGEMQFPVLGGWPNQGTGRINPDGSMGACTSCHPRHEFSIEVARKPYTCSQCHKGPDVPAYKVYEVSKHGNIYKSMDGKWDFDAVPWKVGRDFTAPTCATCHISLVASDGEVVAQRTHRMNDRLGWRLFGVVYAHPHPKSPDTTKIKNKAGLPLPTELTGEPVQEFVIDAEEKAKRDKTMRKVCTACHSAAWIEGHFDRLEKSVETTNKMTLAATKVLLEAWEKGAAKGLAQGDSIFNEVIEKKWVEQWLFYANSTRFASAMAGADLGVFAGGRWHLSRNLREMTDWLEFKAKSNKEGK